MSEEDAIVGGGRPLSQGSTEETMAGQRHEGYATTKPHPCRYLRPGEMDYGRNRSDLIDIYKRPTLATREKGDEKRLVK